MARNVQARPMLRKLKTAATFFALSAFFVVYGALQRERLRTVEGAIEHVHELADHSGWLFTLNKHDYLMVFCRHADPCVHPVVERAGARVPWTGVTRVGGWQAIDKDMRAFEYELKWELVDDVPEVLELRDAPAHPEIFWLIVAAAFALLGVGAAVKALRTRPS